MKMKSKHQVGNLEIGVDLFDATDPWFVIYVKNRKEKLRLPLLGANESQAKAAAALLAGMIRENQQHP